MVKTGYISFVTETLATQDENGNWVPGTKTQTDFVKCNLKTITSEYITLQDGQVKQASYSIYIDNYLVSIYLETVSEIVLQDNRNNDLGNHQIMNVEYLELSKRIKIVV